MFVTIIVCNKDDDLAKKGSRYIYLHIYMNNRTMKDL